MVNSYGETIDHKGLSEDTDAEVFNVFYEKQKVGGLLIQFRNLNVINFMEVSHESYHTACEIMDFIGFRHDYKNQEPMAYLIGWIAECCQKVLISETNIKK